MPSQGTQLATTNTGTRTARLRINLADVRSRIIAGMKIKKGCHCPISCARAAPRTRTVSTSTPGSQAQAPKPKKKKSLTDIIGAKLRKKESYSSAESALTASTSASTSASGSNDTEDRSLPVVSVAPISATRSRTRSCSRPHRTRREEWVYSREHMVSLPPPSSASGSSPSRRQTVHIPAGDKFPECHVPPTSADNPETLRLGRKILPIFWPDSEQDDTLAPPPGLRTSSSSSSDATSIDPELTGFRPLAPPPYHRRHGPPAAPTHALPGPRNVVSARP
ncbi:hypothetical protein CONPUDRAFT_147963 [Coniophora puteana RWD-64-598 SS2]|uniref:Uncharacterized protein n=1 Tax=Coniophora puteana (strain RWD-64-598) TaxID=741705 RepID=R7SCV3_CONPW|nr:uncharacterized protein CONPUDRAFT_147963 [Coniophora puteana RWD-64-598 SS2]EIW74001.1 hypothetical protein CONPUDRAFT_147963 [Coniophora puteana RWD-64-598 SS2]